MRRRNMGRIVGISAFLVAVAVVGSADPAAAQCCSPPKLAAARDTLAGRDSILVLGIAGMTCDGCATQVKKALSAVKGVKDAKVSYSAKEARVRIATPTSAQEKLIEALKKAGFDARVRAKEAEAAKKSPRKSEKSST